MATKKPATKEAKTSAAKTNKPDKKPATKPANKPTSKPAKTTTPNTKPAPKKKETGRVIACIIGFIACIALVGLTIWMIACNVSKNGDSALVVEDGDGNKLTTQWVSFDEGFRIKVPKDFTSLSSDEIKERFGSTSAKAIFESKDQNANLIIASDSGAKISNDQINTYLDTMKSVFSAAGKVLDSKSYTIGEYNVGTIKLTLESDGESAYEQMNFFSQDGNLVLLTFTCKGSEQKKWEPVGQFIMDSIDFETKK